MSDDSDLTDAIRSGEPSKVYLLVGEEFLIRKSAEEIVEALVPRSKWALNVTVMENPSPAEIARDLLTMAMFPGAKVVWVREPEFLLPKKGRVDVLAKARDAWNAGKRKDAARRVLAIAARAGWRAQQLDPSASGSPTADDWKEELGIDLSDPDRQFLTEVARFCLSEGITPPESDGAALEELLAAGLPKGHHLVVESSSLDTKNPLAKKLEKAGELVERKVERELRKLDIHDHLLEALRPLKKRISQQAEEKLKSLCGSNMRLLDSELEKLAMYVGDRATLELTDVELLVERSREEEYLELSNALQARKFTEVMDYALQAMGQGQHPLQILGAVASVLRRLVIDKERYGRMKLSSRMSYRDFQEEVYPELQEEAKREGKKLGHAYVCYLGWQAQARYDRAELLQGLLAAGDCDLAIKSSADPRAALERLLIQVCSKRAA